MILLAVKDKNILETYILLCGSTHANTKIFLRCSELVRLILFCRPTHANTKTFLRCSELVRLILFCRPTYANTKTFLRCSELVRLIFLLHPAALNENITIQLRSFSLECDSQHFHIDGHKLPGIDAYFEMKARHVAAQT